MTDRETLRKMIGQRLVIGLPGTNLTDDFLTFLRETKIGNIILFERNIESDEQLSILTHSLREAILKFTGIEPFICIDQEGGGTSRLNKSAFPLPGAMAIAASGNPENARLAGQMTGQRLRSVGVNFNLAPVMDVNSNPQNPIICERSYGDNPRMAADFGTAMMEGLLSENSLSCLKHFPGHGDTRTDSHLTLPSVAKTLDELLDCELIPFIQGIKHGAPAIMTAHILFPNIEKERVPATMSRTILTDLLREKFGFEGLILSDCLEMQAIKDFYGITEGCIRAFEAGVDLALISHTRQYAFDALLALEKKVSNDASFLQNLEISYHRILEAKEKFLVSGLPLPAEADLEADACRAFDLLQKSITLVNGPLPALGTNPLFLGCNLFCATGVENTENKGRSFPVALQQMLGGTALEYTPESLLAYLNCPDRLKELIAGHTCLVLGIYHADQWPAQLDFIQQLSALKSGCPIIVISLKSPYELFALPSEVASVVAWEYSEPCFRAVSDIISGLKVIEGKLPISSERP